jgi:hypothetical protein
MSRSRRLRRDSRRALALGVGLSLAAHAAVFALVRMEITPLAGKQAVVAMTMAELPTPFDEAPELIELDLSQPAPRVEAASSSFLAGAASTAGSSAPAAASASTAPESAGAPILPTVSAEELSYDQLVVMAPVPTVDAPTVPFDELPVAQTTPAAAAEDAEVPVYVPGSIGRAKRGWATTGDGEERRGDGPGWSFGVVAGSGDGHCPMPGRGGRVPPPTHPGGDTVRR